ncbi:PASTA domain-containing protein [Streptomyces glomeratus]|uniref:PASTA domain-containing protein n=1 Tax=Streptomyces glomeratus TaxID=284452 RepID=UPI001F2C7B20|nr:PASTA domain-containing protein [Streptomyces glomeratus]MCF1511175.1 PASTA domain-containing protein [Streptomyces glomeratus]
MTRRAFLQRTGKSAIRRIGFLLAAVLLLSGCSRNAQAFAVKAVAAGVPSLAPFFDERSGLGHDTRVRAGRTPGGLQAGNTPGLYGGSRQPTVCDVTRLKKFLTDPANDGKAKVWARVEGIAQAEIPDYLDRLTPVLLRHDTLVQNHDYKKGEATPFDSLLQAGIAVLVNEQGQPTVKCSCGNPLRPFQGDTTRISVKFEGRNEKWAGYDRSSVVVIRPAPQPLTRLALVDVDDPHRGLDRPVGTTGRHDAPFDTRVRHKVPDVAGLRFAEAGRRLAAEGLAVAYAGRGAPPDEAAVTGSDPAPGTELAFGQYVTLSVDTGETEGPGVPGGSGASRTGPVPGTGGATGRGPDTGRSVSPSPGGSASGKAGGSSATPSDSGRASSPPTPGGSSSSPAAGSSSRAGSGSSPTGGRKSSTAPGGGSSSTAGSGSPSAPRTGSPSTTAGGSPTPSHAGSPTKTTGSSPTPPHASSPTKTTGSSPTPPHAGSPTKTTGSSPTPPHTGSPTKTASGSPSAPRGGSPSASSGPTTARPVTSRPATGAPVTSVPATREPPFTRAPVTGSPTAGTT